MSMCIDINTATGETFDFALNQARQVLYRCTALALCDPRSGSSGELYDASCQRLVLDASALVRDEPAAVVDELARGELPLARLDAAEVLAALPCAGEALNAAYETTFGLLVSSPCPPYESEYVDSKFTFQRSQVQADVAGFYRAFGVDPSEEHPERHDHIVLELEFMALLVEMERRAEESAGPREIERGAVCRAAQQKFLTEHLAWWTPAFARLLARENPGGFYASVGSFLMALIPAERALLGVATPPKPANPTTIERPEECDGCVLQS